MTQQTRLAVDIGGTFTDLVLDVAGTRFTKKVLTTPQAPEEALIEGSKLLLREAGTAFCELDVFIHGTTLATNAILERRGARTALLATEGFRDILDIATESRFDQYDLQIELPKPLISRELRFGVRERIDSAGSVLVDLDLEQLASVVTQLREAAVESVAIAFLHSYANPAHEREVAAVLRRELPGVTVTLSSEVCPEIKEYERTSTAAANAYVQPLMDRYLGRMLSRLDEGQFRGSLYLVTSSGALTTIETARKFPVRLVESGPAGGAIYASSVSRALGEDKVLSFDMGGTTAKVCIIKDFAPLKGRTFEVDRTKRFRKGSGLPIRIPVTEMVEIGAGGGSIAGVDAMRNVTVGPESASSEPGPASFGRGGQFPTVTDANLMMGLLDPATFAAGTVKLDRSAAQRAFDRHIAQKSGLDADSCAYAVYEIVCENMASAARAHAVEMGESLADYTMVAFGGAAPLHAARVAEKLGIRRVLVPPNAGVGSAVGFLTAPIAYELVRSAWMSLARFDPAKATELLESMSDEATEIVKPASGAHKPVERRAAFVRYVGQSNELEVELPLRTLTQEDAHALRTKFEDAYTRQFTRVIPNAPLEILNWSVRVSLDDAFDDGDATKQSVTTSITLGESQRRVFEPQRREWVDVSATRREDVGAARLAGPALVVERDTTTFVTASFQASVGPTGCITLDSKSESKNPS
jgi:N-methylhydantoinase A